MCCEGASIVVTLSAPVEQREFFPWIVELLAVYYLVMVDYFKGFVW